MLGYPISELGQEAWIFYKWAHSAIDKVVNQHGFHSVFDYELVAQPDGQTTMTMIMWDKLNTEMRHLPLLQAQKLHVCNIMPSLPLVPGPDLNLSDPKGLLTQFLPSVSELLLHQQNMLMLQRPERAGSNRSAGSKTAPSGAV